VAGAEGRLDQPARAALAQRYATLTRALLAEAQRRCGDRAQALNDLAWELATAPPGSARDPKRAAALARRAVGLTPEDGGAWNTLGVALCAAGCWKEAALALGRSVRLRKGGDAFDWFPLAVAEHHLGNAKQARDWFDRAVRWTQANRPGDQQLKRFRDEAAGVLGVP
jgi:tetratricopeptide (TPR) repeat protein